MTQNTRRSSRVLECSLHRLPSVASIFSILLACSTSTASAVDLTWDPAGNQSNSGGAGTWDLSSLFWNDDNTAPNVSWQNSINDRAIFAGIGGTVTINTSAAGTGVTAGGLIFAADGYNIASDEVSEVLTLGGLTPGIDVGPGTATINTIIAGAAGLTKIGAGTLNLRAATGNTLSGNITIDAGTLDFAADNQLGNTGNDILLNGGRLNYSGTVDWDPGSGRVINTGSIGGVLSSTSRPLRITDTGQITGSGNLIREGAGNNFALDIQRPNVGFTGNLIVNSSVVEFRDNLALGNAGGQTVTVNGGIFTIATGPSTVGNRAPTLAHNLTLTGGTIAFGNQIGGRYAGNVQVAADSGISVKDFYQEANRGGAIDGILSGTGRLTVTGATAGFVAGTPSIGSVLLTNPANTYSGTISIGTGTSVRAIQGAGVNALAAARVELNGGSLGLAPVVSAPGSNAGLFGRYYNSTKINNGVAGGFDFGKEVSILARTESTINSTISVPIGPGVNLTNMGVLWTGILEVTSPGTYSFSFRSDDGSVVYVNGQQVVANDFSQGATERFGSINLAAGTHPLIIKYAQGGGGASAQAFYNGPDTGNAKVLLGTVSNTVTNNGDALFPATTLNNPINVVSSGDLDLPGANATSTGALTFSANASFRVTGVTGFETLTQAGPVTLNGNNTISAGITLTGNQTNTHGHNSSGADLVITGVIGETGGASGIIKDGPRKVTLTGTNTFTGPSTVNGGTLAGSASSIPSAVLVNVAGTLEFNQASNGTYSQVISGTGSLTKTGAGTLSLNGTNSFTGVTTVTGGILTGTGSIAGAVRLAAGGAIGGTPGATFTVGSLTFEPNSAASFGLAAPSLTPQINVTGSLVPGRANITLTNAGGMAIGTYRLIDYTGAPPSVAQFAGLNVNTAPAGFLYGIINNGVDTAVDLAVESIKATNTWTGSQSGVWDLSNTANWSGGTYTNGEQAVFGAGPANRNITGPAVAPQRITVNGAAGNDYAIANIIEGTLAGGLQKSGANTLRLTGANTHTGPINVSGGALSAAVSSTASGLGSSAVTLGPGTTLELSPAASTAVPGVASRYFTTTPTAATNGTTNLNAFNFAQTAQALQTDTNLDPAAYTETVLPAGGLAGFDEATTNTNWKNFAIERIGKINISTPGWYGFHTFSDDGSRIYINGRLLANANGGHGTIEANGSVFLTPGLHDFRYEFIQGTGGADERISYSGPGIPKQVIPSTVLFAAENAALGRVDNNVFIGTPVTAQGNATLALSGTAFTGVELGALITNGGTITVTGPAGKLLASRTTTFNGTVILNHTPDLSLGKLTDGGAAVTLTKSGTGRLLLDNFAPGSDANVLSAGSILNIQSGEVYVKSSSVAGATNPMGLATVNLNGGKLIIDSAFGGLTIGNPVNVLQSGTVETRVEGQTINMPGAISIAAGATLTLDLADGTRGSSANNGFVTQAIAGNTLNLTGGIIGDGNLTITSSQTTSAQMPITGTVFLRNAATHTGLTTLEGKTGSMIALDIRGLGSLLNTSGINVPGEVNIMSTRINLHNSDPINLGNRLPDSMPWIMRTSTLRFDGGNAASASETIGAITLAGGQNNLFGGNVSGTAFATLNAASITRQERSTLRIDGNNMGALTAANGVRFLFANTTGFTNSMVGGGGTTATNVSIIPWVWGAPTGNNRALVTYGTNGLRTLADSEYTTLAASVDATDNIRETYTAATTIGSGAAQTVNAFVAANTGTADLTLTLAPNTVLILASGTLMLSTTDGTARRVTLAGGTVDFGSAEGVLIASRREHTVTSRLTGSNGLTITGDGGVVLNNSANSFSGPITVAAASSPLTAALGLLAQNEGSLGNLDNDLFIDGSSFRFVTAFTMNANRTVTIGRAGAVFDTNNTSSGIAGQVTGTGPFYKVNANTLTLSNATNNYSGETFIHNGNLVTNTGPQGNIHHYAVDSGGFAGTNRVLTFNQSFNGTYGGDIDGVGDVVKSGTGAATFTGQHTYVGTTTINGGSLFVNGSINGSTTRVNTGTLGGIGNIAFDVQVGNSTGTNDAILSPGVLGIGEFNVGGNVSFGSDAAFHLDLHTTNRTADLLDAEGAVTLGLGLVSLTATDLGSAALTNSEVFTFISAAGGVSGEFLGLPEGSSLTVGSTDFTIHYAADSVSLTAVPEPCAVLSLVTGLGILATRRRRS